MASADRRRLLGAALAAALPVSARAFRDPLDTPAAASPLAARRMLHAAARAGDRLVVAGWRGHVLHARAGSLTPDWESAEVPVSVDLTAIAFADADRGWIAGHDGVLLHTTDGGRRWERRLDGRVVAQLLQRAYGADATPALRDEAARIAAAGPDKPLLDVHFADHHTGFAVGAFGLVLHTDDAGRTWQPWLHRADNPQRLHLHAVRRIDGRWWIAGEQGLLLRLDAAGSRFEPVASPYAGSWFGIAGDARGVVLHGLRGNVWRSADARSWQRLALPGAAAGVTACALFGDGTLALATLAGELFVSRDGQAPLERRAIAQAAPWFGACAAAPGVLALVGAAGVQLHALHDSARKKPSAS